MATVNSQETVDTIIKNNGYYEDDPRVVKIVKYQNAFDGRAAFGLIWEGDDLNKYSESQFVINPEVIWEAK